MSRAGVHRQVLASTPLRPRGRLRLAGKGLPEGADGQGPEAIAKRKRGRAGVQDDASQELVVCMIPKPGQVLGIGGTGSGGRLDLEGHQLPGVQLGHDVDLMSAVVLAEVEQSAPLIADLRLPEIDTSDYWKLTLISPEN